MNAAIFSLGVCFVLTVSVFGQANSDSVAAGQATAVENSNKQTADATSDDFSNPFSNEEGITTEGATEGVKPSEKKEKAPPFWYKYDFGKKYVTSLQKNLNMKVSSLVNEFKASMNFNKAFLVFFFSFIYAVLHSGGPGHGKLLLGTYFLTNDDVHRKRDAAVAGIIVSITHNGMAVLLSGVLYLLIHSFGDQRHMQEVTKQVGGVLVILTGLAIMLTSVFRNKIKFFDEEKNAERLKRYPFYLIAILSGIVPCPLAWSVLVLCITMNLYWLGLVSVFGMAIGAGITVGVTGLIVITGKESLFTLVNRERAEKFAHVLRFGGGVFLVLFGYLMTKIG